jgi:AcrR family transcriptional regulator
MSDARAPGRPRDPAVQEAIAVACRDLITEVGYSGLTIESVAERAGVGRPTIYRRWPSKAHMVWDVLFTTPPDAKVIGDTGDVRADVEFWIRSTMRFFAQPDVARAFPGLLADGSVEDSWHSHLRDPVRKQVLARLRRAVAAGELRGDADLGLVFDLVTGLAIYRACAPQPGARGPSVRAITDQVLRGSLTS